MLHLREGFREVELTSLELVLLDLKLKAGVPLKLGLSSQQNKCTKAVNSPLSYFSNVSSSCKK